MPNNFILCMVYIARNSNMATKPHFIACCSVSYRELESVQEAICDFISKMSESKF
jgi:hypothetical protein